MKNLIFIPLFLLNPYVFAQFTEIKASNSAIVPFSQSSSFYHIYDCSRLSITEAYQTSYIGVLGIINSLKIATNNGPACFIVNENQSANHVAVNYTKLGFNAPFVKTKLYTGTTSTGAGANANSTIYHGLDASKILDVKLQVDLGPAGMVGEEYTFTTGYQTSIEVAYATITVLNSISNSINIRNKPFTIFITYEQ
jgi:hypothetical protein